MTRLPVVIFQRWSRCTSPFISNRLCKKKHVFYRQPDGRTTTVPNHPGRDLARPLIREILREIELTPEQFQRQLKRM